MINIYTPCQQGLILESDKANEFPIYLYWPKDNSVIMYSTSINELLNDIRVQKPLKVSVEGLSFLLQNGVIPPPQTAYEDIYIIGLGDKGHVTTRDGKVYVSFSHQFPFINPNRPSSINECPDESLILEMLAEATIVRTDPSKPIYLFHSAGKDSNSIALALAEAGWQHRVQLITQKSKGKADESEISAKIAKQLGFKHKILHEVEKLEPDHRLAIEDYFITAPFPCVDNVTLAYPLYAQQLPELKGANIIDGGGNDSYMMTPPSSREIKVFPLSKFTQYASSLRSIVNSESAFSFLIRTPAEWFGMSGLSFADAQRIFPDVRNVYPHWKRECQLRKDWDLIDFKTSIFTSVVASEMHIRKARNFTDSINSNLILPFANKRVAEYFGKLPEAYLFDRKSLKNKIILRNLLKQRIGLDSDAVGKMGWTYDSQGFLKNNQVDMINSIMSCSLWNHVGLKALLDRFQNLGVKNSFHGFRSRGFIYRLYLISMWHNQNKYLTDNR